MPKVLQKRAFVTAVRIKDGANVHWDDERTQETERRIEANDRNGDV